jgi:hypothetical protein
MVDQNSNKDCVFLVYWMSYDENGKVIEGFDRDDCLLIGVYNTRKKAESAVTRAKLLPGFSEYPDYFLIDRYEVNRDHWTAGFTGTGLPAWLDEK